MPTRTDRAGDAFDGLPYPPPAFAPLASARARDGEDEDEAVVENVPLATCLFFVSFVVYGKEGSKYVQPPIIGQLANDKCMSVCMSVCVHGAREVMRGAATF